MSAKGKFELIYAPVVKRHLRGIESKYYSLIRDEIEAQLQDKPDVETRNRKPLKRPGIFGATWEIRFGSANRIRVLYKVDRSRKQVAILAIGEKQGERLLVGGEEVDL